MGLRALVAGFVMCAAQGAALADLSGVYEPQNWADSGIAEGTTTVTPESGLTDTVAFGYSVDLGNPGNGVTFRTAEWSVIADRSGVLCFEYDYTGNHRFFMPRVYLEVFAMTSDGVTRIVLVDEENGNGHSYQGTVEIEVEAGMAFGVIAGGGNFDSNSRIDGTVTLSEFSRPLAFDGAYAMDNWVSAGISEGTTQITPETGNATVGSFAYNVDLGSPGNGVSFRTAEFSTQAGGTGPVTFEYSYTGNHRFFDTRAYLEVFAETADGVTRTVLVDEANVGSAFEFTGEVTIDVEKGRPFGVVVGGGNFDSNSRIDGQVDITKFSAPRVFDGPLRLESWANTGIEEGTTSTNPTSGPTDRAEFSYNVDLGNPGGGVTFRTTEWSVLSPHTGLATFGWHYEGFHAFFDTEVYLEIFAGDESQVLINQPQGGEFTFGGSIEIPVQEGVPFGIIVGGGNFDSNSIIRGTVGLESLTFGACPSDFNSDGTVNTIDVLMFLNAWNAQAPEGDFNGDGNINTLDVLAFLNAWTAGC